MFHKESMHLCPGDLVVHQKAMFGAVLVNRLGLVVGVRYDRKGQHIGCEYRVDICFSDVDKPFETMCDCELFSANML